MRSLFSELKNIPGTHGAPKTRPRLLSALFILACLAVSAAGAWAQKPVIVAPAAGADIRGNGTDGKNIIRFTTTKPSDFLYYADITELDQNTHAAISATISVAQAAASVTSEGSNTYSYAFDFNRAELAALGSGLFRIQLRAVGFSVSSTSDPVEYFKGRTLPTLTINADNPRAVTFTAAANDPDSTPNYTYTLHFVPQGSTTDEQTVTFTSAATSINQSNAPVPALIPGRDYNVTLTVADTIGQPPAAGQGLTGAASTPLHANAPPTITINAPAEGAIFQSPTLPFSVPFTVTPNDDAAGVVAIEVDVNGDGVADATGSVAAGSSTIINVPINSSAPVAVRVRGTDDKNQVGEYATRTIRVNTPPAASIISPAENQAFLYTGGTMQIPVNVTTSDSFSATVFLKVDINNDGIFDFGQDVPANTSTVVNVPISFPGAYTIRIRPVDGDGAEGPDVTRLIRVNTPPTVQIQSPASGSIFVTQGGTTPVTVRVLAHDDFSQNLVVHIAVDGFATQDFNVTNDVATDLSVLFGGPAGYAFHVTATDADDATGAVANSSIVIDDYPVAAITSPTSGGLVNFAPFTAYVVNFTGSITDTFAQPDAGHWTFNNGGAADGLSVSHTFGSTGFKSATFTATDTAGASDTATVNFRINDIPQTDLVTLSPKNYDSESNTYLILRDTTTTLGFEATNRERDNNPLRLRVTYGDSSPSLELTDLPPADFTQPHVKDVETTHTYTALGDYTARFDAIETINGQDTTGTLTLKIRVVDELPVSAVKRGWERYE